MLDRSGSARRLRETYTLAQALSATTTACGTHSDSRVRLRRCLRTYLDRVVEQGFLYHPRGRTPVTAEMSLARRDIVERFVRCAIGRACCGPLEPLVEGWLALAESMVCDWMESGVPRRDDLEAVLCDLFFVAADAAHQNPQPQQGSHQDSG